VPTLSICQLAQAVPSFAPVMEHPVIAAFEFCPSELGTRGAVDLPRSSAKLQNAAEHSVASECDGEIKAAAR
jgi:hypothetical protein